MKALYVTGITPITDVRPAQRLVQVAPDLAMTYVPTVADALVEVRKNTGYQVLFTDPTLPQNETLALITSLRRDRAPLALVPVVAEEHRDFLASAVAAGADDVLLLQGETVLHAAGTLLRIRHSPHLTSAENRPRLRLLYAGRDQLVWTLLEQIPFIKAERAMLGADGSCVVRIPGADTGRLRCDVVLIDEQPGDAHPLQVVKSVKSQASDVPVVILTAVNDLHTATAALDLGADEAVSKAGIYRRRLIATLRRLHQRVEMEALHSNVAARETRLRNIVERLPAAVAVISDDGRVLAVNNTAIGLLGAQQPSDIVGREFATLVVEGDRERLGHAFEGIRRGQGGAVRTSLTTPQGETGEVEVRGVMLERDARGGRGVVAVITPISTPTAPEAAPMDTTEIDGLRAAAAEAERRLDDLRQSHESVQTDHEAAALLFARERAAWTDTRAGLESRLADLDARLAELDAQHHTTRAAAEAELARAVEAQQTTASTVSNAQARWDDERAGFQNQIASLEQAQQELWTVRAAHDQARFRAEQLETELAAAHADAQARCDSDRWAFEARINDLEQAHREASDLRSSQEAVRQAEQESARAREQGLLDELASVRSAADAESSARGNLERERHEWDRARNDWDQTREAFSLEREQWQIERGNWDRQHADWERDRNELRAHIGDLERDLNEHFGLRQTLDAARQREQQLLDDIGAAQAAVNREHEAAGQARMAIDDAHARAASIDQSLQQARTDFAGQLSALELTHARARDEWESERARLNAELQAAHGSVEALRSEREAQAHASQSELVAGGRFGAVVATRGGIVVRSNDAFAEMLGYTGAADLTYTLAGHAMPGLVLRGFDELRDATGAPVRASFSLDRRGGGLIQGVGAVRRLDEWQNGEPLFEHMVLTVSRELDLEDRLRHARRLQDVGALATAMVPELESLVSAWMQGGSGPYDAQQAAEVIGQLAAFSRHHASVSGAVDLADVVRRMQPLLEQLAGPQRQFRTDLRQAPASDVADTEVAQLITGLVVFGRDLLPAGGAIALVTDLDDEVGTYVTADSSAIRRARHARVTLTLRGYGLRPYAASAALDALVGHCAGTISAESTGPRTLVATIRLPGSR